MIKIGKRSIGPGHPCFIVAELSANHNGDLNIAIDTIRAAKIAGADAIKLQTYTPDTLTIDCESALFRIGHGTIWDGKTLYELYGESFTPWEWHQELFKVADEEGLICFSSPFDTTSVDFLENLNVPAYKVASFEIQDIPLIEYAASKGKPMIISTGIATKEDIQRAVDTCHSVGNEDIILLKCTSSYPAPLELANLAVIPDLQRSFGTEVGFSDHTMGSIAPVVARTMGACVIEKHLILDKSIGGSDADFSLDLSEFKEMVNAVREAEKLIGTVTYELSEKVKKNRKFGRSLFVVADLKAGETITSEHVRSIRPCDGAHPMHLKAVIGGKVNRDIERGTPFDLSFLA